MYWFKTIFALFFITLVSLGHAVDRALVVGGGCHYSLRKEMAKETMAINQSLKGRGWEMLNLFGDNTNSKDLKGAENATFTKENFLQYLKKSSKELAGGDKFLLNIITHGLPSKGNGHAICLGDGSMLNLNDPEIHKYLNEMKKKGIKMAFMDNSCYGGESIDLFDQYGCTMSTQVPQFPSYSTRAEDPKFRFGVSSILGGMLVKEGDVSMEDLYIESLMQYGEDAQSGLLVFPQMSGDVVGAELAQWGAFYSMLKNGYIRDFDEYTLLEEGNLSSEEKSSLENSIEENVSCREKDMDQQLSHFMSDFDKVGKHLMFNRRHSRYKDLLDKKLKNTMLKEALLTHNLIQDKDKQIKKLDEEIAILDVMNKTINDQINLFLKEAPISFQFESQFDEAQMDVLIKKGCLIGSDQKSLSCPATANINALYYSEFNKKTFKGSYGVVLPDEVRDIISSKFEKQGVGFVDVLDKIDNKIDDVFWRNMDKTHFAQALDNIAKKKNDLIDRNSKHEQQKRAYVEQFKGHFNQMRGIDYLNRSKLFANQKIRNCRSFAF